MEYEAYGLQMYGVWGVDRLGFTTREWNEDDGKRWNIRLVILPIMIDDNRMPKTTLTFPSSHISYINSSTKFWT